MDDHQNDVTALLADLERRITPPPLGVLRQRHRRRQHRRRIATATMSVVVMTAGAVVFLRDQQRPAPEPYAGTEIAAELATSDQKVPPADFTFTVTDVDFVDAQVGWAIGLACEGDTCSAMVRRTPDGGDTWEDAVPVATDFSRALLREQDPVSGGARSLRFVSRTEGYAFNPDLYVTRDGGLTWQRAPQHAKVVNMHAGDVPRAEPWRLQRPCASGESCEFVLVNAPSSPPAAGTDAMLRRSGPRHAWVLSWDSVTGAGSLFATADGGHSWTERADPCPGLRLRTAAVTAGGVLWAACPAPDNRIARSTDGGSTWQYGPALELPGTPTQLEPVTESTAYLATTDRGRLLVTHDGGATWTEAPGTKRGYSYSNVQFVDEKHGFAMGDAGELWRTTDGVTWAKVDLPA